MAKIPPDAQPHIVNKVALGGMNTFDDPRDLLDVECVDILNMQMDSGIIFPRGGSLLYRSKPSGETEEASQILRATNSIGYDFMIIVYGNHFYLDDFVNEQLIPLNQLYTPTITGYNYGSTNWNSGLLDDRFYFGNGSEDTMKWIMGFNQLSTAAVAIDTTLVLDNSMSFPESILLNNDVDISIASPAVITLQDHQLSVNDTVVFQTTGSLPTGITAGTTYYVIAAGLTSDTFEISTTLGGSAINTSGSQSGMHSLYLTTIPILVSDGGVTTLVYYNNNNLSTNTLTLTGALGITLSEGSTITMPIFNMPRMPRGKVFFLFETARLGIAVEDGSENTMNISYFDNPESMTIDSSVNTAVISTLTKGKGGIIGIDDFGEYLLIEKQNLLLRYYFEFSADGTTFIPKSDPVISGDSIGPVTNETKINYMNTLYYPTTVEGIISFSPSVTGSQTSSSLNILSQKVNNYVTEFLDFNISNSEGFNQKLYWLFSTPLLGQSTGVNDGVLCYDIIRKTWYRFDNWTAVDIKAANSDLFYLSKNDGALYKCFTDYQDAQEDTPTAYTSMFVTKRFDFDTPYQLERLTHIYIQGYISRTSVFYVDVLYNENGVLGKQTYEIRGDNSKIVQNGILGGLGYFPFGFPVLGGLSIRAMQEADKLSFYSAYLELGQQFRARNIQIRCYAVDIGSQWGVNNLTIFRIPQDSINVAQVLGPTKNTPPFIDTM